MEDGGTETEAIAALLHDAVEDQGGAPTLERIKFKFGTHVAALVDFCTDSLETPKPPWRERKLAIIRKVALANESEYRILLADKLHNLRSIRNALRRHGDEVWERFKGGKEGSLWYYHELLSNFQERGDHPFLEEMEAILKALQDPAD
jgi:GTP pyrophosphokinase